MKMPFGLHFRWCLLLLACVLPASRALAWSYHSFDYGYSLAVPEDWMQIGEDELTVRAPSLPVLRTNKGKFDCAFQPKRNGQVLEYPYFLIEVIPYTNMGYPHQVDESEVQVVVKANTGLDPADITKSESRETLGGGEIEALDDVLNFDKDNHRFTWSSTSNFPGVGLIRTRQWGFFGKDALVQFTLYEKGRGSDRMRDLARSVATSFKHELGREYQPSFTFDEAYKIVVQHASAPTMGMIVTTACVGTSILFAMIALFTSRRPAPAYEDYGDVSSYARRRS